MKKIPSTKGVSISSLAPKLKGTSGSNQFKTYQDLVEDSQLLAGIVLRELPNLGGVIGVPRSGMLPASVIAIAAGVPLYSFSKGVLTRLDSGLRMEKAPLFKSRPLLLVEDSLNQGVSISKHLGLLYGYARTAAVYTTPARVDLVDFHAKVVPMPHYFAWHFFGGAVHSNVNFGFDLDGVLCYNPTQLEWEEPSPQYDHFIANARPLYLPKPYTAKLILTARLERYRSVTEAWLAKHGIKYQSLVMGPWDSPRDRNTANIGEWKAGVLATTPIKRFIESDRAQALTIASKLKMCVVCTETGEVF